ncbi:unnamed protein product [Blepharisma stoltei]|uniref:Uncharacterized protein n=1 Tax=Blepharisma stoltei TaxID=1481888 RepID=A0AAU9IRH4_9CILI|nr:unnamed protein product [Blepharisma stoltei]
MKRIQKFQAHIQSIIHAFAYRANHDANFLTAMAEEKNGRYYYIEKEDSTPQAFSDCLNSLISVIANHIQVQIQTQACDIPFALGRIYSEACDSSFKMPLCCLEVKMKQFLLLISSHAKLIPR